MAPADLYDEDDLYDGDDYEEGAEEELSAEDQAIMEKGTADVKKSLGPNAGKVTVKQIQEALWHYFYDVEKSVAYLSKTFITPPPKATPKKVPEGKLNGFSFSSPLGLFVRSTGADTGMPSMGSQQLETLPPPLEQAFGLSQSSTPFKPDFSDMPWLGIPPNRQARFISPNRPRGGLLGGAEGTPKLSKLQALAIARKKKNDEKKEQTKTSQAENGLKRLSITDGSQKENTKASPHPSKKLRGIEESTPARSTLNDLAPQKSYHGLQSDENDNEIRVTQKDISARSSPIPADDGVEEFDAPLVPNCTPSSFAKALFGSAPDNRQANRPDFYAMPYASSSLFTNAFSEPSPDDVVLAAQAKGSNFARTK